MNNIGTSLTGFASKTPYAWYADFLQNTAIPNAMLFGNMIRSGELLVGIALVAGGLILLSKKRQAPTVTWLVIAAHLGGVLMNINFYLAAGSTSPSTAGINITMGLIHLIFAGWYFSSRRHLSA